MKVLKEEIPHNEKRPIQPREGSQTKNNLSVIKGRVQPEYGSGDRSGTVSEELLNGDGVPHPGVTSGRHERRRQVRDLRKLLCRLQREPTFY